MDVRHRYVFTNALIVFPAGYRYEAQPYAMRAPEVFLGQGGTGPSQVWAVAAMLLCWTKPGVLGLWDSPHFLIDKAWCMAKIKRLFPNWDIPTPDEVEQDSLKVTVNSARRMSREEPDLQVILPLEKEMQKVEMPQQLRNLLRLMLPLDQEVVHRFECSSAGLPERRSCTSSHLYQSIPLVQGRELEAAILCYKVVTSKKIRCLDRLVPVAHDTRLSSR